MDRVLIVDFENIGALNNCRQRTTERETTRKPFWHILSIGPVWDIGPIDKLYWICLVNKQLINI